MNNYIVTESSKNIRFLARQALKGIWKPAILATFVFTMCAIVPTFGFEIAFGEYDLESLETAASYGTGSFVSSTFTLLVTGAFTFGISAFFLDVVREKKTQIGQVFSGFEIYFKTLGLYLLMGIYVLLWSCLLIVPGVIAAFSYSQAFYILVDDPNKSIRQCLRESKNMMKGNKWKLFCLEISFIGWYLLGFVVIEGLLIVMVVVSIMIPDAMNSLIVYGTMGAALLGASLLMIFLYPYIYTATTVFYEMANGNLRRQEDPMPPLSQETQMITENNEEL